jgi:hypothetical protein
VSGTLGEVLHPKTIGDRTTLAVMLALHQRGYVISVPFGENARYDLVVDDSRRLQRVQCKTGRLRRGAVVFNACSSYSHHASTRTGRRDYVDDVEFFGVYCAETGAVYLVPVAEAPRRTQCSLRVDPARNGQVRGILPAERYEIWSFGPAAS